MGKRVNADGTTRNVLIDGERFCADILAKGGVLSHVAEECGMDRSYLPYCKKSGSIDKMVFKFACAKFGLNEGDYAPRVNEPKIEPQGDNADIIKVLNSINATLLEINRRLGCIDTKVSTIDGKCANINFGVHETSQKLNTLYKDLSGK